MLCLNQQYLSNNLAIYPEHLDHDPGANGVGGYGDLYPANSASIIITQGSSFTDMPFVNAALTTIAAFDPDLLTELIRKRLLMTTVQAVMRQSLKTVKSEADYLTSKAHPVVFDGANLDEEKMVIAAHSMTRPAVPPVVLIRAVSESDAKPGRDFFEKPAITSERLSDTPLNIARVFRANDSEHELTVATAGSGDMMNRPLSFKWVLLQGDPALVSIRPDDKGGATIRVKWHMPMTGASGIRSHRVDIGVFANNGVSTSAPAFITFYMLPNENRFYDDKGRVNEIYYEAPNPELGLPDTDSDMRWLDVLRAFAEREDNLRGKLIAQALRADALKGIEKIWLSFKPRRAALEHLQKDETKKDDAAKMKTALEKDIAVGISGPAPDAEKETLRQMIARGFNRIANTAELFPTLQRDIEKLATQSTASNAPADLAASVKRLIDLGILIEQAGGAISTVHSSDKLTAGERHQLRCLNLTILSQALYPDALKRSTAPLWGDPRLTTPKAWRDLMRYDADGNPAGWLRYYNRRMFRFDAEGRLLPEGSGKPEPMTYSEENGRLVFSAPVEK